MPFGFVFVLKPIAAVLAGILLFHFMCASLESDGKCSLFLVWTYRKSSGLSNFLGFFGQQSQIYKSLIFGTAALRAVGIDIFPMVFVGGAGELEFGTPLAIAGWIIAVGELGFKIDFSWKASRSELGERPPGEGRSYGERLVMLLPPTERVDEYEPDVRMLREDAVDMVRWLGALPLLTDRVFVNGCPVVLRCDKSPLLVVTWSVCLSSLIGSRRGEDARRFIPCFEVSAYGGVGSRRMNWRGGAGSSMEKSPSMSEKTPWS